jgi:hypothetical protein
VKADMNKAALSKNGAAASVDIGSLEALNLFRNGESFHGPFDSIARDRETGIDRRGHLY